MVAVVEEEEEEVVVEASSESPFCCVGSAVGDGGKGIGRGTEGTC